GLCALEVPGEQEIQVAVAIEVPRQNAVDGRNLRLARQGDQRVRDVAIAQCQRRRERFSLFHDGTIESTSKNLLDRLPGVVGVLGVPWLAVGQWCGWLSAQGGGRA